MASRKLIVLDISLIKTKTKPQATLIILKIKINFIERE